jgi:UDP-N-acetylglucosamine 2-epimerase
MLDVAAAQKLGIPTIGVQHGTIFPMHLVYTLPPGQIEGAPTPDYFAAYGDYAKETLSTEGSYPAHRVWVTGSPRFDRLVSDPPDQAAARRRLGLPDDKRVVLVATQFYPWFGRAVRAVFAAVRGRTDCMVCLKTHPVDLPLSVYGRIAEELGLGDVRLFEDRFDELLAACDVLIGASSTTVFEALLLGRRAICVNFSDESDRYAYVADGGALGATTAGEICNALDQVLDRRNEAKLEEGRQRFLKRHAGPSAQGCAAATLAEALLRLFPEVLRQPACSDRGETEWQRSEKRSVRYSGAA